MKLGVVSDIHGNTEALQRVLDQLRRLGTDRIVCLGDVIDPLPGSRRALELLDSLQIPVLRGNHEDYVITANQVLSAPGASDDPIATAPNWEPVRVLARSLDCAFVERLKSLPLTFTLNEDTPNETVFFHASPSSTKSGWINGFSDDLTTELSQSRARTFVCGHWHQPETRTWQGKRLISAGSVGIPLRGQLAAEFLVVDTDRDSPPEHHTLSYDNEPTLAEYRRSGWVAEGGPLAWLLYDEIRTAERRVLPFKAWCAQKGRTVDTMPLLKEAARDFLRELGVWDLIATFT